MNGLIAKFIRVASPRVLLAGALAVGVLGSQSGQGTLAYFTSSVTNTGNTFTAGTLPSLPI